ncbi:hypothetical protein ACFL2H_11575, partial [Planctomycetota bacterium]
MSIFLSALGAKPPWMRLSSVFDSANGHVILNRKAKGGTARFKPNPWNRVNYSLPICGFRKSWRPTVK